MKRTTSTSTEVKTRYNLKTYKQYRLSVRKDSELYERLEALVKDENRSFAALATQLLKDHFNIE